MTGPTTRKNPHGTRMNGMPIEEYLMSMTKGLVE